MALVAGHDFRNREKRDAASPRSSVSSRRLYGSDNSAIAGGHGHAVGATIATVAKRKPVSIVSGEQSHRQLSAGASRQTGP
jgi:hypothetical protein